MKEMDKPTGRELSQPARLEHDLTNRVQLLHETATASPRGAIAFPVLSAAVCIPERLSKLFQRSGVKRNHAREGNAATRPIFILKSTIHLCALLLVFSYCTA